MIGRTSDVETIAKAIRDVSTFTDSIRYLSDCIIRAAKQELVTPADLEAAIKRERADT